MNLLAEQLVRRHAGRAETTVADSRVALDGPSLLAAATSAGEQVRSVAGRADPVVAVLLPLGVDALVHLVAAVLHDHTVCFLDPAGPPERRDAVLQSLRPDVVVDPSQVVAGGRPADAAPSVPGYVAMSSGSTGGSPKAVLTSWATLGAFAPHGAAALGLGPMDVWAEVSHLSYDMAMTNLVVALATARQVQVSGALGDRLRPLRYLARAGATHVRLAPRFVDLAVAEHQPAPPGLRVWGSGGDRLFAGQLGQLLDLGVSTVVNTYGTSESGGFASAATLTKADREAEPHASVTIGVGSVGDWVAGLVPSADGSMLAVGSPHLGTGYLFGAASDGYPRWESGMILTGDLGEARGGALHCLGRSGRRVKRNASFVDLDAIDATVRAQSTWASFTVLTIQGELLSLVEAPAEGVADLRRRLASVLTPDVLPDRLVATRRLPRLGNGKVDHAAAGRLLADDVC